MNRVFCENLTGIRLVRLPVILPNPNIQYHNIKTLQLNHISSQLNSVHTLTLLHCFSYSPIYAYVSQARYLDLELKILCAFLIALKMKRTLQWGILLTYLLTYLLHGAESFLRSQLVLQLIKKSPAFYGPRKFITVLTSARHLSLS